LKPSKLILGMGNDILMDDGIAPRLIKDIARDYTGTDINFESASLGGMETIELLKDYDEVVIIDAIKTRNGVPGTLYIIDIENYMETAHVSNIHDISFLQALKLGKELNIKLPGKITILAIEIVEDMVFGENFTPEVATKYPDILQEIKEFLKNN
jgi:hydrogenase maturation protease